MSLFAAVSQVTRLHILNATPATVILIRPFQSAHVRNPKNAYLPPESTPTVEWQCAQPLYDHLRLVHGCVCTLESNIPDRAQEGHRLLMAA